MSEKKLVIIGDSAFAEVAYEYFNHDSDYQVVAFSVEKEYLTKETLFGLPVVTLETLEEKYPPSECEVFVALTYGKLNRNRARLCHIAKSLGYRLASYVSSKAFVWHNVIIGENCFIFENNVVQPFVKIGNNTILWSGNHIGHHSTIEDHVFISSHVVVSGYVTIESNCFLGVNSTIINNLKIAKDTWVGPHVILLRDTKPGDFYKPNTNECAKVTTYQYFKIPEEGVAKADVM